MDNLVLRAELLVLSHQVFLIQTELDWVRSGGESPYTAQQLKAELSTAHYLLELCAEQFA